VNCLYSGCYNFIVQSATFLGAFLSIEFPHGLFNKQIDQLLNQSDKEYENDHLTFVEYDSIPFPYDYSYWIKTSTNNEEVDETTIKNFMNKVDESLKKVQLVEAQGGAFPYTETDADGGLARSLEVLNEEEKNDKPHKKNFKKRGLRPKPSNPRLGSYYSHRK